LKQTNQAEPQERKIKERKEPKKLKLEINVCSNYYSIKIYHIILAS
jgi:hypothetical protein